MNSESARQQQGQFGQSSPSQGQMTVSGTTRQVPGGQPVTTQGTAQMGGHSAAGRMADHLFPGEFD